MLALNTGMRQGELLALKWEDVDLEGGHLRVRRTLTHADKAFVLGEPKTKNSRRTIRLTKGTISALQDHLSRQLEEIEEMGSLYQPGGLIFATEAGTIINPSNLRNRSLKPLLKRASLPPIRFHDLRHTCATLLLSKNVNPKVVSEMLGHSSISITLARIIHERSGGLRFARPKTDECPSKAANSPHIDSDHSKSRFPYSSTKLGYVNNPG